MRSIRLALVLAIAIASACQETEGENNDAMASNVDPNNLSSNAATNGMAGDMGYSLPDGGAVPDVDDSCVDADRDGQFVDCDDFTGVPGPDCDDADPDNWGSCTTCVDVDGDDSWVGCDRYAALVGPDCDDADPNNWAACDTCVDGDGDGWVGVCDAYDGVQGPDCDDDDANNWMSCDACVDGDSDTYFTGCDAYAAGNAADCDDTNGAVNPGATEVMENNIDDDCNPGSMDACIYTPVPAQNPEPGLLAGVTAEHNHWRWRVGVGPLTWNAALAQSATDYAEQCIWGHDPNRSPDAGFSYVGENLYAGTAAPSNAQMIDIVVSWAEERFDYDFGTPIGQTGNAVVGHYTQLVWNGSNEVGCGYARCQNPQGLSSGTWTIVACRYGPGGNYTGQTPYPEVTEACVDLDNDDVWQGADPDDTNRNVP